MQQNIKHTLRHAATTWLALSLEILVTTGCFMLFILVGVPKEVSVFLTLVISVISVAIGLRVTYKLSFTSRVSRKKESIVISPIQGLSQIYHWLNDAGTLSGAFEQKQIYLLAFAGDSVAEKSRYATELQRVLLRIPNDITIQRQRDNPLTMDLGTTLMLTIGTSALAATASTIGDWLQKRRNAEITIMTAEKKVVVKGITYKEATSLIEFFLTQGLEQTDQKESNK